MRVPPLGGYARVIQIYDGNAMRLEELPKPLVDWLEEIEVYSLRLERLQSDVERFGTERVLDWLQAAYEIGLRQGRREADGSPAS